MRNLINVDVIGYPTQGLYDPMKNMSMTYVNADGHIILRITLSKIAKDNYEWQMTEFGYCQELSINEVQNYFIDFINWVLKYLKNTSHYFYIKGENADMSKLGQLPYIEPSGNDDNIYVCKYTNH